MSNFHSLQVVCRGSDMGGKFKLYNLLLVTGGGGDIKPYTSRPILYCSARQTPTLQTPCDRRKYTKLCSSVTLFLLTADEC